MTARTAAIAMFARAPVPGEVKTRLIPALGATGSAALYARLLARAVRAVEGVEDAARYLYAVDAPSRDYFTRAALLARGGWCVRTQCEGDLGHRMAAALAALLEDHGAVVLIGSDIVDLAADDLRAAISGLNEGSEAVIGPSADGGYWLLGLTRARPKLFVDMAWGQPMVFAETHARLVRAGLRWRQLPMRYDIDTPDDLQRCAEALAALQ